MALTCGTLDPSSMSTFHLTYETTFSKVSMFIFLPRASWHLGVLARQMRGSSAMAMHGRHDDVMEGCGNNNRWGWRVGKGEIPRMENGDVGDGELPNGKYIVRIENLEMS